MALLTLVISSPGSDCIKWERKLKKGGTRCKHRPPPKRNITTIWSDKKNCVFVFISVNLTGDSTVYHGIEKDDNSEEAGMLKLVK